MNRLLYAALLCAGAVIATSSCSNQAQCDKPADNKSTEMTMTTDMTAIAPEELEAIRKPLDMYVKAAVEGDSNIARQAFAEGATMSHAENDSLYCLPIQALYDYYDATGKHPASYEIADVSVGGDVAMVRIDSKFGDVSFCDMFNLVKAGGEWKLVSKIFSGK